MLTAALKLVPGKSFPSNPTRAVGKITVPTMYVWRRDGDIALAEKPARATDCPICQRRVLVRGAAWLTLDLDEQPDKAADLLLEWFELTRVENGGSLTGSGGGLGGGCQMGWKFLGLNWGR